MYTVKVRLARDIGGLYERMNRMMDEVLHLNRPVLSQCGAGWIPEADVIETEDHLVVRVNLAGVRKEEIEVAFGETYLRVEGRRMPDYAPGSRVRYHRLEMGSGGFERIFRVPVPIDPDHIEATLVEGILTVRMTKPGRQSKTRVVTVRD
ncbi:MAG: Hsp20/alpha crystallin family protein [Deltaproteobacteria bacterium]|nr:Hsp20/alpha crystallin family protein [Deltaproteobacteria bacterium]